MDLVSGLLMAHCQTHHRWGREPKWAEAPQPSREYKVSFPWTARPVACLVNAYRGGQRVGPIYGFTLYTYILGIKYLSWRRATVPTPDATNVTCLYPEKF